MGCIEVTSTICSPRFTYEFWKGIFLAPEDIAWAADIMAAQPAELENGAPGAHYSFGGISAVQLQDRGVVFGFTAPLQRSNGTPFLLCDPATGVLRRLDLVRRVLPPYGHSACPVDLFGPEGPFILRLDTPGRVLYSLFNFEEERAMAIKLPDDREYDVWNFFEERYEGRVRRTFSSTVPAVAARHFAFTPVTDRPRVIGTSFHITCGAVELSQIQSGPHSLSGYLTRPQGDPGKIFILDENQQLHTLELTGAGTPLFWEL